jgi:hypothetical protein
MRLAIFAAVLGLSAFAADAALADSCPQLMDEFGDALVKATADDSVPFDDRAAALALHDEGEALYDEGDDDQCTEKLKEALAILRNS